MSAGTLTPELISESCCTEWLSESTVDKEGLRVKNVTLCGNESKNGYRIPPSAFKSESHVRALYEGKHVYLDHNMDRNGRSMNPRARSVRELAAVVENVKFIGGKPRSDFKCFDSEAGKFLLSLAEAGVNDIGPSHVAAYEYTADRSEVKEVLEIASVDIVCFPATTRNFSEQHHGDGEMAENKLEVHLESQVKELQEKSKSLETENTSLSGQVKTLSTEKTALETKNSELSEENKTLKLKLDEFQSKEALESRRAEIHKDLKDAKLDPEDSVKVSKVFMESLMGTEDAAKRKELIADRAAMVGESSSGDGHRKPTSTERKSGGESGDGDKSKKFDAERWDKEKDLIFAD